MGVDAPGHLVEFRRDAVLLAFEDGQWDGVGVVGLHQPVLFGLEPAPVRGEPFEFVGFGGHEPVELVVQHPGERGAAALGGVPGAAADLLGDGRQLKFSPEHPDLPGDRTLGLKPGPKNCVT
ncbi:hypothetical protein IEE94_15230 [Yimella sp. cx-573]|nr:hypothetical protein [Yimella sp. cx-573]